MPDARATWVRVEREGSAAGLAARVRHPDAPTGSGTGSGGGGRPGDGRWLLRGGRRIAKV